MIATMGADTVSPEGMLLKLAYRGCDEAKEHRIREHQTAGYGVMGGSEDHEWIIIRKKAVHKFKIGKPEEEEVVRNGIRATRIVPSGYAVASN